MTTSRICPFRNESGVRPFKSHTCTLSLSFGSGTTLPSTCPPPRSMIVSERAGDEPEARRVDRGHHGRHAIDRPARDPSTSTATACRLSAWYFPRAAIAAATVTDP